MSEQESGSGGAAHGRRPGGPLTLVVLDGFGLAPDGPGNAVAAAHTDTFDALWRDAPRTTLEASGRAVGLPPGQMGNSEVGHVNLGAGRVVPQSLTLVQDALDDGSLARSAAFRSLLEAAQDATLHLFGLVSDGGVHADLAHLEGLVRAAVAGGAQRVRVHAFSDGRDTAPDGGAAYLSRLERFLASLSADARVATVIGRYFAMDRDERWDRTERAYRAMAYGEAEHSAPSASDGLRQAYERGETDEFVAATVIHDNAGVPVGPFRAGDAALCFNFRADRARQLCRAIGDDDFSAFDRGDAPRPALTTLMPYDATLPLPFLLQAPAIRDSLGEVLSEAGLRQYRTAETEKYPHVTYFFNATREEPFAGEERRIVPSPKVATYDLAPEMSAAELAEATVRRLHQGSDDFVLVNFANPDMVGHTGDLQAAIRACEASDAGLGRIREAVRERGGVLVVLADHGNAEMMIDPDSGGPHTAHTTNPVPFVVEGAGALRLREGGTLGDVAPTVLELLGVAQPEAMTGRSLIQSG